jgi:general stress protein 26
MDQEIIKKAVEIISVKKIDCVLSLIDLDGYPIGSTITVSKNDGINWITFCTGLYRNSPKRVEQCNRASVCFFSVEPLYNITLVGKIEVITDQNMKNEMWYDGLKQHYTGPEDKDYCVLKFVTERYKLFIDFKEVEGKI